MAERGRRGQATATRQEEDSKDDVTVGVPQSEQQWTEKNKRKFDNEEIDKGKTSQGSNNSNLTYPKAGVHKGQQTKKRKQKQNLEELLGSGKRYLLKVVGHNSNLNVQWIKKRMGDVQRDGSPNPTENDSNFLYHGTDQDSALSILKNGIKLEKGSSCQDFSDKDGFYVNYDYEQAKKWAHENMPNNYPAVIVFEMKPSENVKYLKFIDINQKSDWQDIVKFNRSGRKPEYSLPEELSNELKKSHYITGPMCEATSIPDEDAYSHWKPSGYESENEQLCVISEDFAKKFTSEFMVRIILFGEMSVDMEKYLYEATSEGCSSSSGDNATTGQAYRGMPLQQ